MDRGYAEHGPAAWNASLLECVWVRHPASADGAAQPQLVLPDNCADLIFQISNGTDHEVTDLSAVGIMSRPIRVPPEPGVRMIGLRFRPGMSRALFGIEAHALRDQRVALSDLAPRAARDLAGITGAGGARDLALAIQETVRRHISERRLPSARVREAIHVIEASRGTATVREICERLGVTRQQLARLFRDEVGLSPKSVARVTRFRHAISLARARATPAWASLAAEAGFHDQSHLGADFRALAGSSPDAWRRESGFPDVPFFLSGDDE